MDLKERTSTDIFVKYLVTTFALWGLAIGVLGGFFWLLRVRNNSMAESLLPYVIMVVVFSPMFIPDKSARVALNNQRILPSDTHLNKLGTKIVITNIIFYSLPFIVLLFIVNEHHLIWIIVVFVVNIVAFLSSFWKFRPKMTKLSSKVETIQNDIFEKDEEDNILDVNVKQLPEFRIYPSKAVIKNSYDAVISTISGFIIFGIIIGPLLDLISIFLIILFLAPTLAFGVFYFRINYYKFKKNPLPFEIEHGNQLTKMVFKNNLIFFLVITGFTTMIVLSVILDGAIRINSRFWILIGLVLLFFIISFLPLFILSHIYFKKLEAAAYDAGRFVQESAFNSKRLRIKGKKTDESLKAFFTSLRLENMNYLVGLQAADMNIDDPILQSPPPSIMAFNDTDLHLFSYYLGSSRITHTFTFPMATITILRTLEHYNQRRVEFLVGNAMRILFIAEVGKKRLNHQEEMFGRFIDLLTRKVDNNDITDEYERFIGEY